ncbi:MAG: tetratricopeptide repeat protein [Vampirovibrio sp.]|nr:tetratricopeptide repeat protein [Vampirovibrio sp.]
MLLHFTHRTQATSLLLVLLLAASPVFAKDNAGTLHKQRVEKQGTASSASYNSDQAQIHAATGYSHYLQGDLDQARHYYEKAIKLDLDNPDLEKDYLQILEESRQWSAVRSYLIDRIRRKGSLTSKQALQLAQAQIMSRQPKMALKTLEPLVSRHKSKKSKSSTYLEAQFLQAAAHQQLGDTRKALKLAKGILKQDPNHWQAHLILAKHEDQRRKWKKAIREYEAVLKARPDHRSTLERLSQLYLQEGHGELGLNTLKRTLAYQPNNPDLLLQLARLSKKTGQSQDALNYYRQLLDVKPDHAEALFEVGYTEYNRGDRHAAYKHLTRFLTHMPTHAEARYYVAKLELKLNQDQQAYEDHMDRLIRENPDNLGYLKELWETYDQQGNTPKLADVLQRVIQQEPKNEAALSRYAQIQLDQQDYSQAITTLDKLITANKTNGEAYYQRGSAYEAIGQTEAALENYLSTIKNKPSHEPAHAHAGLIYLNKGDQGKAKAHLETSFEQNQSRVAVTNALADIALKEENLGQADTYLTNSLQLDPNNPVAQNLSGAVNLKLGEDKQAIQNYTRVLEQNPDKLDALTNAGVAFLRSGQPRRAVMALYKASQISPTADRFNSLGLAYQQAEMKEDAVEAFKQAVAKAPKNIAYRYNLGNAYKKSGYPARAKAQFNMALHAKPETPDGWYNQAKIYYTLGLYDEAIGSYRKALSGFDSQLDKAQVHLALGYAHEALGHRAEAVEAYEAYLGVISSGPKAVAVQKRLRRLE